MRKNEYFVILDTETAGDVTEPFPYDLGYVIVNRKGEVKVQRSFCLYEVYVGQKEKMKTAYYADKIPQYEKELKEGKRKLVRMRTARNTILKDMEDYKTNLVYAYNVGFDRKALNNISYLVTEGRYRIFFPKDTEFRCIWNGACQVLLSRPTYLKFAIENGYVSEKNNILTNAECCYRYITKNTDFIEEHKGIDDVLIEKDILLYCFRQHKKIDFTPNSGCWQTVQRARRTKGL